MAPESRRRLWRAALLTVSTAIAASGVGLGLTALERRVHALPRTRRVLALQWDRLPDWLKLPENQHILETLADRVRLGPNDRLLDRSLARRIGTALADPSVGWIKRVDRVTIQPNGVVRIRCRFRRPTAWVRRGSQCYLVDAESVRLPGRYAVSECSKSALLMISGVRLPPPEVGHLWPGADLSSGLKLAALISGRSFRDQIDRIIVANQDGRIDRNRPHIELATDRPGARIWWGRPPEEEYGTEITARQKLTLLEMLHRRWGRIDLNRAYVDIRTYPDSVSLPAASPRAHRS